MKCFGALLSLALSCALVAAPSGAAAFMPEFSAGVKLSGGGNLWTEPDDTPGTGVGFRGDAGGYAIGGGVYAEIRALSFLGLELGLLFEKGSLWRNVDINGGIVTVKEEASANVLRVPILAKIILPLGVARLSAGVGPELILPQSSEGTYDIDAPSNITVTTGTTFDTKTKSSTMLALDLGLVIEVGDFLEIPISLRAARNLSQDDGWAERTNPEFVQTTQGLALKHFSVEVQNSWDFRLMAG